MVTDAGVYDEDWLDLEWSPWVSLEPEDEALGIFSTDPGLYRVRHPAYDGLIYIGETGRSLRGRLRALIRGVFDDQMPYSDPHTASPSLWAIADRHGRGFEVSGTTTEHAADKHQRKAIEEALIARHRRDTNTNLIGNFGRMPPGYTKSRSRSTGDRGTKSPDADRDYTTGVDPLPWTNATDVLAPDWMGLDWSNPRPLSDVTDTVPPAPGLYRIWNPNTAPPLEYIGQSVTLKNRLTTHRRNRDPTLHFSYTPRPENNEKFQLSQTESELIGAHWLATTHPPTDQF
ncbi:GIY-YIG nuclease family protein [Halorubellus litoreus]|uniref:GIY-YIG nuclease family protein n=1 Tax=Halorubellus litoreus TaxID=755308 RepID=A0ABD5VM86_9EURY